MTKEGDEEKEEEKKRSWISWKLVKLGYVRVPSEQSSSIAYRFGIITATLFTRLARGYGRS